MRQGRQGAATRVDHVSSAAWSCVPGRRRPAVRRRPRHPAAQGDFAGGAVGCTREARAVRRSSLKLATVAPPGSGARTSTSPGRRRWFSRAWPLSPAVAPMIDQGGDAPQRQRPPEPQRPRRHAADRPWTPLLDLQHCSAPQAFSSQTLAGRPLCPALRQHLPVTSSGSSSSTPILRRSKRC